jgi:hypothetical protein
VANTASTPRLINVSVLKQLSVGGTITAGFVLGGSTPRAVLVRAVGPSLTAFGVAGALADPRITLYQSGVAAALAANDNWSGTADLAGAFATVGAFALESSSRDAALHTILTPGSYTVQATGAANTGGYVLLEIYEAP